MHLMNRGGCNKCDQRHCTNTDPSRGSEHRPGDRRAWGATDKKRPVNSPDTPARFGGQQIDRSPAQRLIGNHPGIEQKGAGRGYRDCPSARHRCRERPCRTDDSDDGDRVRIVLPEYEPPPLPLSALWPRTKKMPARTRLLIDFMAARLASEKL